MAIEKVINIKVNDDQAIQDVNKLNKSLNQTDKEAQSVSGSLSGVAGTLDSVTGGGVSKLNSFKSALGGVTGGFKTMGLAIAATGIGALIIAIVAVKKAFTSSEEGQNAWTEIMEFLGIVVGKVTDGISYLGEIVIKVFKSIGSAINAVAGAAARWFDTMTLGIFGAEKALNKLNAAYDETAKKAKQRANDIAKADKEERKLIVDRANADQQRQKLLEKSEDRQKFSQKERIKFLKEASKVEDEITKREIKNAEIRLKVKKSQNADAKSTKEDLTEQAELQAKVIELKTAQISKQKEVTAKVSGLIESENAQAKSLAEARTAKYREEAQKRYEIEKERIRNIQNLEIEGRAAIDQAESDYYDSQLDARTKAENDIRDYYFNLIEQATQYGLDTTVLEMARNEKLLAIDEDYKKKQFELDEAQRKKDEAAREADIDKRVEEVVAEAELKKSITKGTLQTIANIAGIFAGGDEKRQRKAFQIQKAVSIAQATIDTYKSANAAFASGATINPIFGAVAAAGAITAGLLNVRNIAKTQFGSSSVASSSGSSSSIASASSGVSAPNFNVVGNANVNQLDNLNKPIKAYVVGGEVTTQQQLDRNKIATSTF